MQKVIESKKTLLLVAVMIAILVKWVLPSLSIGLNHATEMYLNKFVSTSPDTNIVIVEIGEEDINKLGWPVKRNYYALLINKLNQEGAKTIGLEVFLSPELSFQEVYNRLIVEVINENKNVVLGSIVRKNDLGSLETLFPAPYKADSSIITGHLNFFDFNELTIPLEINTINGKEKAFSYALYKLYGGEDINRSSIQLNIKFDFSKFRRVSMIEYLTGKNNGINFDGKLVLIGVTANSLAKFSKYYAGIELPGIGIHSFALSNMLNKNFLVEGYKTLSTLIVLSVFLFLILIDKNQRLWMFFIGLFIIYAFMYLFFNLSVDFAFLVFSYFLVELTAKSIEYLSNKRRIEEIYDDKNLLAYQLKQKEKELIELQREIKLKNSPDELNKRIEELQTEIDSLRANELDEEKYPIGKEVKNFEGIIYSDAKMQKVVDLIRKVGPTDATVLIYGESGSGKELVAKALHQLSDRRQNNYLAINCAALTESLLESELFGYVKGAFTNAVTDKPGLFEAADNGTIFLDEIGEISPAFQAKLLRVLQNGEYYKVGATSISKTNARVIAATNKNLELLVKEKKFREDLFYRLNVITINLPPLRERKDDIPVLAEYFIKNENENLSLSKAVISQLLKYEWKGNVRELESVIKRAAIFALSENREIVHLRDLPDDLRKGIKDYIPDLILESLRKKEFSHSSINETASELGSVSRTVVSENLRGMFFKYFVENGFDLETAVKILSASDNSKVNNRLKSKTEKYLHNIKKDVEKLGEPDFELVKIKLHSKYKNLPQKYHRYLDEIIKTYL